MDWSKGFSAGYYACLLDKVTWRESERFEITGGNIRRADSSLIESAQITTTYPLEGEKWIRIYMDAEQNGDSEHVAMFTGLAIAPQKEINGNLTTMTAECYSVLKPAEDVLLEHGYYIESGMRSDIALWNLLEELPAPLLIDENAPRLQNTIIAEDNESRLSMAWKVVNAINWRMKITGDGQIHICPKASEVSCLFSSLANDSVEPQLRVSADWFSRPNVFRAISGDNVCIARDEDGDSLLSIASRGREVWAEESGCVLNQNEPLEAYAERRLKEEQAKAYKINYSRRYFPELNISDIVQLHYPAQKIEGNYKIISQTITLTAAGRTEEEVEYS